MTVVGTLQRAAGLMRLLPPMLPCLAPWWAASGCDSDDGTKDLVDAGDAAPDPDAGGPPESVSCSVPGTPGTVQLRKTSICDGISDCRDGADEIHCPDVFACRPVCVGAPLCAIDGSEVRAVPNTKRCDRKADCPFADDEQDCPGSDLLFCDTNDEGLRRVYEPSQVCDGRQDCYYAEDERGCPDFFACANDGPGVVLLAAEKVCDGVWNCPNDEFDCPGLVDPYSCPNGKRIARKFVCDGYEDCQDGSEELDPSCHQFRCTHSGTFFDRVTRSFDKPWYIDQVEVCDGKRDCHAGNDEDNCP